ncbi:MAG: type II toxin-antitoxin system VapC family toxin [Verrucomicrobia bacterium]|nr:type II toxin-antitoxin system VapC family toxin [Verrucomicrobiota bacterium]
MSLWVLDTDTVSLLLRGHTGAAARVAEKSPDQLAITIVTVEELLSGWHARIRQARTDQLLERAYLALQQSVGFVSQIQILSFDELAISRFNGLRRVHRRVGTNDLKIAGHHASEQCDSGDPQH